MTAENSDGVPVIRLENAPGARSSWDRPGVIVALWRFVEVLIVCNPLQPSSRLRRVALRSFGARIGEGVIIRPRVRVHFPWKLQIGSSSWIGEGVWIHNQDSVVIGHDVVISQETFLTTGSHRHRTNMALVTRPIAIGAGTWVTSRCIVTGGVHLGRSVLIEPMSVVSADLPDNTHLHRDGTLTPRFTACEKV